MNQLICYTFIDNLQDSCVSWNCTFVYTDDSATGYSRQTAALSQFLNLIYPPCMNSLVAQKQNEKEMGSTVTWMIILALTGKRKFHRMNPATASSPILNFLLDCTVRLCCLTLTPPSDDKRQKTQQRLASVFCEVVKPPVGGSEWECV